MKQNSNNYPKVYNFPEDVDLSIQKKQGLSRRGFIGSLMIGAAAFPLSESFLKRSRKAYEQLKKNSVKTSVAPIADESYWTLVKQNFPIRTGLVMLNAANLCPTATPVQQLLFEHIRDIDQDTSSLNRAKFSDLREISRLSLAQYLGASPSEIAITRNTSEGNNMIINGLIFNPEDEVIIWDENHPTANIAWDVRAERNGFKVTRVKLPEKIYSREDLINPFKNAISRQTRLLCFSHLSNISGTALPAEEICRIARQNEVLTHIDGAQTFGSQAIDLHSLGCDFYTGSAHKWFCGPKEVGVLYVREERINDLWPTIVGVGYPEAIEKGAQKFETLGQRDDARIAALGKTVEFFNLIGKERIEARINTLALYLKQQLKEKVKNIQFRTPHKEELSGGVIVFTSPRIDLKKALNTLYYQYNIGAAVFGGDLAGIRLCPHIYNTMEELEQAAQSVAELAV